MTQSGSKPSLVKTNLRTRESSINPDYQALRIPTYYEQSRTREEPLFIDTSALPAILGSFLTLNQYYRKQ